MPMPNRRSTAIRPAVVKSTPIATLVSTGEEITPQNFYEKIVQSLPREFGKDKKPFTVDLRQTPHSVAKKIDKLWNSVFQSDKGSATGEENDEIYEMIPLLDPTWTKEEVYNLSEYDHEQIVTLAFAWYKHAKESIVPLRLGKR